MNKRKIFAEASHLDDTWKSEAGCVVHTYANCS